MTTRTGLRARGARLATLLSASLVVAGAARDVHARSCTLSFQIATTADVGVDPRAVAVADFDRDGALDVATADFGNPGTVTVRWGDGAGGFDATPTTIHLGSDTGPVDVVARDFDGDGTTDLAVALSTSQQIRPVFKDLVGRTFTLGTPLSAGGQVLAIAAADIDPNRDGVLDLVSAGGGAVRFWHNDGTGSFTAGTPVLPGGNLSDVAVGDFNRDGWTDAVVTRDIVSPPTSEVVVLINDGSGGWAAASFPLATGVPLALDVGDLNRDGRADVVVGTGSGTEVNVFAGDGAGGLGPAQGYSFGLAQTSLVLADLDRDGILDLAAATPGGLANVQVALGDGAGGFGAPQTAGLPEAPTRLAAGDFDHDGLPDIAGSWPLANNKVVLVLNDLGFPCANSSFAGAGRLQPLVNGPTALAVGDWNRDGIPDVATAGPLQLSVLTSVGDLSFFGPVDFPTGGSLHSIAVADFDLDGDPDLAVAHQTTDVLLYRNMGGAFVAAGTEPVGTSAFAAVAGDFDGDGAPDLVTMNRLDASLTFFPGEGSLTFGAGSTFAGLGAMSGLAAGDLDGDGLLDLAVASDSTDVVGLYKGNGAGGFAPWSTLAVGDFPTALAIGRLNGDGLPDIAVANGLGNSVSVLVNQGSGNFAPASFATGDSPQSIVIGDANGDGLADIVVANRDTHDVSVLFGNGAGGFPSSTRVRGANAPRAAALLDADQNGTMDLVVATSPDGTGGSVTVLPGDGLGNFGPVQLAAGAALGLATGDFDRDGRVDLLTVSSGSTDLAFHKGQGNGSFDGPVTFPTGLFQPNGLAIGDFNRDGKMDALASTAGTVMALLLGDGAGGFSALPPATTTNSAAAGTGLAVGDFDRDGYLDVAKADILDNSVTVRFGDGAGGFDPTAFTLSVGLNPSAIVTLDYNRNGILDLAVTNFSSSEVSLLAGTGTRASPFSEATRFSVGSGSAPSRLAVADFDGDGLADLAVTLQGTTPGRVAYFRGTGTGFAAQQNYPVDLSLKVQPDGIAAADVNADGWLDLVVACRGRAEKDRFSVRVLPGRGSALAGSAFGPAEVWTVALRQPSHIVVDDFDRNGKPDFVATGFNGTSSDTIPVVLNSNCRPRRLRPALTVSTCNTAGVAFGAQPGVVVEDHGGNPIECNLDSVGVSILPGTGTAGATLSGPTSLLTTNGGADWTFTPLSIALAGTRYRLRFDHALAGSTASNSFSVSPSLTIDGPASYCAANAATFSTAPKFDTYRWYLDGLGPNSYLPSLAVGAGALDPGLHSAEVDATADTCPATASSLFTTLADLSDVVVAPGGPVSVCASCTGTTLSVTETGGGTLSRRWGYRANAGGPVTWLSGEVSSSYQVEGADFPGVGVYLVVEETTPECGVPTLSGNQVAVTVTTSAPTDVAPALTVRSTSALNHLEWIYPAGYGTVAIRYRTAATWNGCTPPASVSEGEAPAIPDQTGTPGERGSFDHGSLANDTTYCYTVFAKVTGSTYAATGLSARGRPFDTDGAVKWAFSMGIAALSPPGLGPGILHAVDNNGFLHAMDKGAGGGAWPTGWSPYRATGPSQNRPASVPFSPGPPNALVYLGSQAGAGNNAVAVNAESGLGHAGAVLGKPLFAGPAGMFTAYGGAVDAILFGTRQTGADNEFWALDPATLNPLPGWPYEGEAGNRIGEVHNQAAVDYANDRVYFASYQRAPGVSDTVWCLDLVTGARCSLWPVGGTVVAGRLGDIAASPTMRGARLYVAPLVGASSEIEALDKSNGSLAWTASFKPSDGQVKAFLVPDQQGQDLYFSTTNRVWSIRDEGTTAALNWSTTAVPGPSQPVFFAGTGRVYVGGSNGNLYVLSAASGSPLFTIPLGDGGAVGSPTVDQAGGFVYVGTVAGVVYAVAIP